MDLDDLRIFRAVVQEGGITRAATKLNRVQSNVTTRVRQLEQKLGIDLFVREGKRMLLSPAGSMLLDYAERLLDLAEEARNALTRGVPHGRLRLGSMESTAAARLPSVLARFHSQFPDVQLELRTGATGPLLNDLAEGRLDCALVSAPVLDARLATVPIFEEQLVIVAPSDQPPISAPRQVRSRTLLAFEPGCAYRQRLESWLASDGLVPERVIELSSYHAMAGCAAAGMGIALFPESLLSKLAVGKTVSVHRLPAKHARATTVLATRRAHANCAVDALKQILLRAGQTKAVRRHAKESAPAVV